MLETNVFDSATRNINWRMSFRNTESGRTVMHHQQDIYDDAISMKANCIHSINTHSFFSSAGIWREQAVSQDLDLYARETVVDSLYVVNKENEDIVIAGVSPL